MGLHDMSHHSICAFGRNRLTYAVKFQRMICRSFRTVSSAMGDMCDTYRRFHETAAGVTGSIGS
jgi:hypothetical protein